MRNYIILFTAFSVLSLYACSQKNVPENVKKAFSTKYSAAQSVKWDNETADEWEAEFKMNNRKMSACYDNSGKWIDSETEITEKELPKAVLDAVNSDFQGYKKKLIEIFESPEISGFELTLKKGESSLEIIFDNGGKILKKSEVNEEDEENEKEEN